MKKLSEKLKQWLSEKKLIIGFTLLTASNNASAAISLEQGIQNFLKLVGYGALIFSVWGVYWGIQNFVLGFTGLSKAGDQQADPNLIKKFWFKIISGLGAALSILILYILVVYFAGTDAVIKALSFGGNDASSYINLNL